MVTNPSIKLRNYSFNLNSSLWEGLNQAQSDLQFCQSWLDIFCSMVVEIQTGVVIWYDESAKKFVPLAVYPKTDVNIGLFQNVFETVIKEKKGVVVRQNPKEDRLSVAFHLGYPIKIHDQMYGVVAVEMPECAQSLIQESMRILQWSAIWLVDRARKQDATLLSSTHQQMNTVIEVVSKVTAQARYRGAAMTLVNQLAFHFQCHRVSLGWIQVRKINIDAVSHSSHFYEKMNLVQQLKEAMEECVEQQELVCYPEPNESVVLGYAHEKLAQLENDSVVCSVPALNDNEEVICVITFERIEDRQFDQSTLDAIKKIAAISAPVLQEKKANDTWLVKKLNQSFWAQVKKLVGPKYWKFKIVSAVILGLVLYLCLATGEYRVTSFTTIEGEFQRASVSPFNGYIREAHFTAGDLVNEGDLLCKLDDEDLRIERLNIISQKLKHENTLREARADNQLAQVNIIQQQINQAEAQLQLYNQQIERTEIKAPFDGIIVTGDMSQILGAPVEKGEVLFEIAPLDSYRVILQVDEYDIREVNEAQTGVLVLKSLPSTNFEVQVTKITPITIAREGKTYFEVEAQLTGSNILLRPGMEGYSKIYVDRRKMIWIWTHDFIQWAKLWVWKWMP